MTRTRHWIAYSLLLLALAAGCAAPVQQSTTTPSAASTPRPASPSPLFPTASDAGICTADTPCVDDTSPAATLAGATPSAPADQPVAAQPTATPDLRLDPADWREWPVVPERVSDFTRQVYRKGLELGNDPRHFSKIGDCQAIREVLMGVYDKPGQYRLPEDQPYLADTIEHFAGSFNRDGQGVKGGFNAAAVLSPLWADPQACQPGETPMECEYRTYRPSIVIISLEVWWDGRTPDRYVEYMRRIIEFYIEKGVVPVLSTKADNVEGDHAINLATAQLAYEYDLPLWNWWRAAQALPNRGLDPGRPDGFHISYEAWTPRGRTALQSLDAVWRMLNDQSVPAAGPSATATPALTATSEPTQSVARRLEIELPTAPAEEPGPAGWLLVGLGEREGEALNPAGAVQIGLVNAEEERVLAGGQALLDASADGRYLLAAEGSELALHDLEGEETVLLSTGLVTASPARYARQIARWLAGGIAFLEAPADGETEKPALTWLPLDGSRRRTLDTGELTPGSIAGGTAAGVYWLEDCGAGCDPDGLWFSPLDGSPVEEIGTFRRPQLSLDGATLAFLTAENELGFYDLETQAQRTVRLKGDAWIDFAWSPDGAWVSALKAERSDYSGKLFGNLHWLVNAATLATVQLPELEGLNARLLYAPDGLIYRAATLEDSSGYRVVFELIDPAVRQVVRLTTELTSDDFLWVSTWAAH